MRKKKKHEDEVASEQEVSETLDAAGEDSTEEGVELETPTPEEVEAAPANPPPAIENEGEGLKKPELTGETKAEAKAKRFEHPGTNTQSRKIEE